MEIDVSGGRWRWRALAFDGGDGQSWALAFDSGDGRQLCQRWMIEMAFNGSSGGGVRWGQQRSTALCVCVLASGSRGSVVITRYQSLPLSPRESPPHMCYPVVLPLPVSLGSFQKGVPTGSM